MAIPLKVINTNEEVFNNILDTMASRIITVSNINLYFFGYKEKQRIFYNGQDTLIIQEYLFAEFANLPLSASVSSWKQIVVRKSKTTDVWEDTITGPRAYFYIMKILKKYYTDREIKDILNSYTDVKTEEDKQVHITVDSADYIQCYENCVKYDINGAHQDALVEMFPRAVDDLKDIYNKRKIKRVYKDYMNLAVGQMKHVGYEGAYWWIVHRTSKMLKDAIATVCPDDIEKDCKIIYANTDGFIVSAPDQLLEASQELGKFKQEAKGPVYVYTHRGNKNETSYTVYQYEVEKNGVIETETKGNVRLAVRDKIDLKNGNAVSYKIRKEQFINELGEKMNGPEIIENLQEIKREVKVCL